MSKTIAAWFSEFRVTPAHFITILVLASSLAFAAGNYKSQFESLKSDVAGLRTEVNTLSKAIDRLAGRIDGSNFRTK